jgi:glycosyltransferase involved in cell wall biosynthesis
MKEKIFAVIPAYNEEENITSTIKEVKKYVDKVIIVDDGSTDKTSLNSKKVKSIILLKHLVNMGKGLTMKTGIEFAINNGAKKIVVIDADGQHDPAEIPKLLNGLNKNVDFVLGIRQMPKNTPIIFKCGNWGLNKIFRILFGAKIDDTQNGFRVFNSEIYNKIKWSSAGYFVETEMIINAIKNKVKFSEIPVKTYYHDAYKGTTVLIGLLYLINMIEVKLKCL